MNTKIRVLAAIFIALLAWVPNASAQDTSEAPDGLKKLWEMSPAERQDALKAMSDEDRNALRESARAYREQQRAKRALMTPEEREAARQKGREQFDALSPEEQEAIKKRRAQRRKSGDGSSQRGQGRDGERGNGNSDGNESQ